MICLSENVPDIIRASAEACGPKLLHHTNKYSHKDNFVPCGHSECDICVKHRDVVIQMEYNEEMGSLMLTESYPEVYLASTQKSSVVTYKVCKMLKSREYEEVTPRMWVEAWNGLKQKDPMYPMLSELMTKFVNNQMGDNKDWTKAVLEINKQNKEEEE